MHAWRYCTLKCLVEMVMIFISQGFLFSFLFFFFKRGPGAELTSLTPEDEEQKKNAISPLDSYKSILANGFGREKMATFTLRAELTSLQCFAHRACKSHFFIQESKNHRSGGYMATVIGYVKTEAHFLWKKGEMKCGRAVKMRRGKRKRERESEILGIGVCQYLCISYWLYSQWASMCKRKERVGDLG